MKLSEIVKKNLFSLGIIIFLVLSIPITLSLVINRQNLPTQATNDYGRLLVNPGPPDQSVNQMFTASFILRGKIDAADLNLGYDSNKMTIEVFPQAIENLMIQTNINNANGENSNILLSFVRANDKIQADLGNGKIVALLQVTPKTSGPATISLKPETRVAADGVDVFGISIPPEGLSIGSYNFQSPPPSTITPTPTTPFPVINFEGNWGTSTACGQKDVEIKGKICNNTGADAHWLQWQWQIIKGGSFIALVNFFPTPVDELINGSCRDIKITVSMTSLWGSQPSGTQSTIRVYLTTANPAGHHGDVVATITNACTTPTPTPTSIPNQLKLFLTAGINRVTMASFITQIFNQYFNKYYCPVFSYNDKQWKPYIAGYNIYPTLSPEITSFTGNYFVNCKHAMTNLTVGGY